MPITTRIAAAALLAGATAAHAGYSVTTSANTGRGYARGCAAQYNIGQSGARFINNAGGGAPCVPADFQSSQGATVAVSGSTDTTGTLTAAHDESSVVRLPDAASATTIADLKTASIALTASAVNFSAADASGQLQDTLHFTIAGATASTVTFVPVSFSIGGSVPAATVDYAHAGAQLGYGFYFGNASAYEYGDYGAAYYGGAYSAPTFDYAAAARVGGWVSSSFASYTGNDTRFSGIYAITGASADIPIDFSLSLSASNAALDSLGTIGIGKVAGVSFTSDSGVFLQPAVTGGVPDAPAWALMLSGFGVVGVAARQRRRQVVAA